MIGDAQTNGPRPLSALLLLGILAFPLPLALLLLRPGYSRDLRIGGFLYALLYPALHLTAQLLEAAG